MVAVVLDNLAVGLSPEAISAEYPPLTVEDVLASRGLTSGTTAPRTTTRRFLPDSPWKRSGSIPPSEAGLCASTFVSEIGGQG
jgi:hypothetical protein